MKAEPCTVCRNTEFKLIDGFYYCIECGTQDVNIQETLVEHKMLADDTFARGARRKVHAVLNDGVQMSGEWHKWHTFNFILTGWVNEVVALGGSSSFKSKALWIWGRYMKKYVNKELMAKVNEEEFARSKLFENNDSDTDEIDKADEKSQMNSTEKYTKTNIKKVTKSLLIAIIYIALNFDKSDIQLSHLCRYIREGRISLNNFKKFIPKEMNIKSIPNWRSFLNSYTELTPIWIQEMAMTVIHKLDLGKPIIPDLRKLLDDYLKDLCLPHELKGLVLSLMYEFPYLWDTVKLGSHYGTTDNAVRLPDYEGVIMTYILVAMKICFGLDDDYELKLSNAVENINKVEKRLKSHKLGRQSNPTDRMFSFREWCNFIQFRKTMLSKYCLMIAQDYNMPVDDQVFMGQLERRSKYAARAENLVDAVTMDIVEKLQLPDEGGVIPRSEFPPSLTPLSSYTQVILSYMLDPELQLLLSEDFTQYSVKYLCQDFKLIIDDKNIIKGVSEENKTISDVIKSSIDCKKSDFSQVFVRNCENRYWLTTKPPTVKHVKKVDEDDRSVASDHSYDSESEDNISKHEEGNPELNDANETKIILETIDEEAEGVCIFDDDFSIDDKVLDQSNGNNDFHMIDNDLIDNEMNPSFTQARYNPETFDREKTIKELILKACNTYRIPIPQKYKENTKLIKHSNTDEAEGRYAKRRKTESDQRNINLINKRKLQQEVKNIKDAYYSHSVSKLANEFVSFGNNENEEVFGYGSCEDSAVENEVENSTVDVLPNLNPEFDDKIYDVSQLYVKFKDEFVLEDFVNDIDDPEIDKWIEQKILEDEESVSSIDDDVKDEADSEDETEGLEETPLEDEEFENLIEESTELTCFKYWFRHYNQKAFSKSRYIKHKFDMTLKSDCSISFNFVIQECASMLGVTAFSLYKLMQKLEECISS